MLHGFRADRSRYDEGPSAHPSAPCGSLQPQRTQTVWSPDLPGLERVASGKVREVYRVDPEHLLIVASDRLSAFDVVFPDPIPRKGEVLTQLSVFWFEFLKPMVKTHFVTADVTQFPEALRKSRDILSRRSMMVRAAEMEPVECVARGYLAGSGWKEYRETGAVCGIPLPPGLREGDRLPEVLFTPASKAKAGHDENIPFGRMAGIVGQGTAERLRTLTVGIYESAAAYALERGVILADTKFEFGWIDGELALCDEALTPDSSRFWPRESWAPGEPQPSYDKQFVRDYVEKSGWNKRPPAPRLPEGVIAKTTEKYVEAYRVLTGREL